MDSDFEYRFERVEKYSEDIIESFEESMPSVNKEIYGELKEFLSTLSKNSDGTLSPTIANLKEIDKYSFKFSNWLNSKSKYSKAAKEFINGVTGGSELIHNYFGSELINTEKGIYQAVVLTAEQNAKQYLLGSGINANFESVITKTLKDYVTTRSDYKQVQETLSKFIIGDQEKAGKLTRYIKQQASDTVSQFNSSYMEVIGRDLGLKHYYYKGTKISDTRELCNHLAGKFYTEEELSEYITRRAINGWSGMIPGTTWENFKIYRGGYSCRHYLLPVSKAVYNARVNKA